MLELWNWRRRRQNWPVTGRWIFFSARKQTNHAKHTKYTKNNTNTCNTSTDGNLTTWLCMTSLTWIASLRSQIISRVMPTYRGTLATGNQLFEIPVWMSGKPSKRILEGKWEDRKIKDKRTQERDAGLIEGTFICPCGIESLVHIFTETV